MGCILFHAFQGFKEIIIPCSNFIIPKSTFVTLPLENNLGCGLFIEFQIAFMLFNPVFNLSYQYEKLIENV